MIRRLFHRLKPSGKSRYKFFDAGFHGDEYLLALVDSLAQKATCFIETGANVGSTLAYVARAYPQVTCISCEPDEKAFKLALQNTSNLPNVTVTNATSQEFLEEIAAKPAQFFDQTPLFWLDAHGYGFRWPLKEEVAFFTTRFHGGYILVDDFKVPDKEVFSFHRYDGQECSFEYVREALNPQADYRLYYPDYTVKTSEHHPLTGWGLLVFGNAGGLTPPELAALNIRNG